MTATPVANDPMEVIRLFNLMERDESKRFPVDYAKFQEQYLDINGLFRPETKKQVLWIVYVDMYLT